jgi:uncharacterized coiled-coil DUF342 family protein
VDSLVEENKQLVAEVDTLRASSQLKEEELTRFRQQLDEVGARSELHAREMRDHASAYEELSNKYQQLESEVRRDQGSEVEQGV